MTFTIVVSGVGTAPEFDVSLADLLPSGLIYDPATFSNTAGLTPTSIDPRIYGHLQRNAARGIEHIHVPGHPRRKHHPGPGPDQDRHGQRPLPARESRTDSPYNPSSTAHRFEPGTASVTLNSNSLSGTSTWITTTTESWKPASQDFGGDRRFVRDAGFGSFTQESIITNTDGGYSFTGIPPGTYKITEDRGSLTTRYKGTDQVGSQGTATSPPGTLLPPTQIQPPTARSQAFGSSPVRR